MHLKQIINNNNASFLYKMVLVERGLYTIPIQLNKKVHFSEFCAVSSVN